MLYLVCYDIVNDRRREKVAKLLQAYGIRVQKSVFECILDTEQLERLQKRLRRCLNAQQDQLRFYPLPAKNYKQIIVLGIQPEYSISDRAFIV